MKGAGTENRMTRTEAAKRAAILRNEQRFQTLIDRSPDATLIHWEGKLMFANPAAAALLGYETPAELQRRHLDELVVAEDRAALLNAQEDGAPCEVRPQGA